MVITDEARAMIYEQASQYVDLLLKSSDFPDGIGDIERERWKLAFYAGFVKCLQVRSSVSG